VFVRPASAEPASAIDRAAELELSGYDSAIIPSTTPSEPPQIIPNAMTPIPEKAVEYIYLWAKGSSVVLDDISTILEEWAIANLDRDILDNYNSRGKLTRGRRLLINNDPALDKIPPADIVDLKIINNIPRRIVRNTAIVRRRSRRVSSKPIFTRIRLLLRKIGGIPPFSWETNELKLLIDIWEGKHIDGNRQIHANRPLKSLELFLDRLDRIRRMRNPAGAKLFDLLPFPGDAILIEHGVVVLADALTKKPPHLGKNNAAHRRIDAAFEYAKALLEMAIRQADATNKDNRESVDAKHHSLEHDGDRKTPIVPDDHSSSQIVAAYWAGIDGVIPNFGRLFHPITYLEACRSGSFATVDSEHTSQDDPRAPSPAGQNRFVVPSQTPGPNGLSQIKRLLYIASWDRLANRELLEQLLELYPGLEEIIGVDPLYFSNKQNEGGGLILGWNEMGLRSFPKTILGEGRRRFLRDIGLFSAGLDFGFERVVRVGLHALKLYLIPTIFQNIKFTRDHVPGKTVALARNPGWEGMLSHEDPDFYYRIFRILAPADTLMLIAADLPLNLFPPSAIGLDIIHTRLPRGLMPLGNHVINLNGEIVYRMNHRVHYPEYLEAMHWDKLLFQTLDFTGSSWTPELFARFYAYVCDQIPLGHRPYILRQLDLLSLGEPFRPFEQAISDRKRALKHQWHLEGLSA